jgi:hypothetical protein
VVVKNYPKDIKAFYMRLNDDGKTVAAMDVLAPGIGEIIGGSQREERLEVLDARLAEMGLNKEDYWWYRDLRRYGTVPHSGFGLGFERLVVYVTGMGNVRDVIPFPRTPAPPSSEGDRPLARAKADPWVGFFMPASLFRTHFPFCPPCLPHPRHLSGVPRTVPCSRAEP